MFSLYSSRTPRDFSPTNRIFARQDTPREAVEPCAVRSGGRFTPIHEPQMRRRIRYCRRRKRAELGRPTCPSSTPLEEPTEDRVPERTNVLEHRNQLVEKIEVKLKFEVVVHACAIAQCLLRLSLCRSAVDRTADMVDLYRACELACPHAEDRCEVMCRACTIRELLHCW